MTQNDTQAHTPAPWTVEFEESGGYDCMSSAYCVKGREQDITDVDCASYDDVGEGWAMPSPTAEANARRIVAAVNACEGISTSLLESLPAGHLAQLLEREGIHHDEP